MASITNDDELCSFDVPEASRHSSRHTLYKIILQVTPKELTENSYQVCYRAKHGNEYNLLHVMHKNKTIHVIHSVFLIAKPLYLFERNYIR